MPSIDVNKKRNDPNAEVTLRSFWDADALHDSTQTELVPYERDSNWGHIASRTHDPVHDILVPLGRREGGGYLALNLSAGHSVLAAGSALSGTGVFRTTTLRALTHLYPPEVLQLVILDPIRALADFNHLPHMVVPRAVSLEECCTALRWCKEEKEARLTLLNDSGGGLVYQYNQRLSEAEPRIPSLVLIISEIGELAGDPESIEILVKIAQMARALEIHVIATTQRPGPDYLPRQILANIPQRIAFQLPGETASRLIIDAPGAEKLLGQGDALYYDGTQYRVRFQGFSSTAAQGLSGRESKNSI